MRIDRDKFLSALFALTLSGAAIGCSSEQPPAAEPPVEETTGSEAVAEPPPAPEAPAPAPAAEPVPEVQPAGPTPE